MGKLEKIARIQKARAAILDLFDKLEENEAELYGVAVDFETLSIPDSEHIAMELFHSGHATLTMSWYDKTMRGKYRAEKNEANEKNQDK